MIFPIFFFDTVHLICPPTNTAFNVFIKWLWWTILSRSFARPRRAIWEIPDEQLKQWVRLDWRYRLLAFCVWLYSEKANLSTYRQLYIAQACNTPSQVGTNVMVLPSCCWKYAAYLCFHFLIFSNAKGRTFHCVNLPAWCSPFNHFLAVACRGGKPATWWFLVA